jgi:DNA-binding transcriptional regulator YiaG
VTPLEILSRTFRELPLPVRQPQTCDHCNPPRSGVYLLADSGMIVYVGSSTDIVGRIRWHRSSSDKRFNLAMWMALPARVLEHYEGALIRALSPVHNRKAPRHVGYDNEILSGLGLAAHDDEYANVATWAPTCAARIPSKLGLQIKEARLGVGITQDQLGAVVGCSGAAVAQWESGVSTPTSDRLIQIATVLGVNVGIVATATGADQP